MDFDDYGIDPSIYDEMFLADGEPRTHSRQLHETLCSLSRTELNTIQEEVTRSFLTEGVTFTVYGDDEAKERIIPVDCLPRVLSAPDWQDLEESLRQRLAAINLFLSDVYGPGQIISDGVIPLHVVRGCPQYRRGFKPPHGIWVAVCGTDLVRTNDGFFVLEDNLRDPSGVSYMIANRKAVKTNLRRLYRGSRVREVEQYGSMLRATLAELVEGRDLLVAGGFVYARTTKGLRQIDVIYRRIDDDYIDPLAFRSDSLLGVPGLMHACKLGNVTLANAPGTGVADDKSVYAYVLEMIRYYLGQEPKLANVKTYLCRRPEDLEYTLDNLDQLIVKRVGESGGYGMLVGPHASERERTSYAAEIRSNPVDFVAQPTLALSHSPCFIDGRIEPRHVDPRPFVLSGRTTRIVPGAFCRVALRPGSLVVNSSQGGGGKDLWVLEN